jgi:hypothetical protein
MWALLYLIYSAHAIFFIVPSEKEGNTSTTMAAKRKYGKRAQKKVGKVMREYKKGTLKSGRSRKKVVNRKQAIAIGLSEARRAGARVPPVKKRSKKSKKK